MLKKIHLLFAFAFALPAASYGLVGGPWDNGDYSQALDEAGIYQATLRFSNGQGFCQFGSNVSFATFRDLSTASTGLGNSSNLSSSNGSVLNRSLIYYKGVTYLGSCYGTSDLVNNVIDGITNGNSDVTTITGTNTGGIGGTGASSVVNTLIANGARAMNCNTAWSAKITSRKPVLKFNGKGQLTVLNPDGRAQVLPLVATLLAAVVPPVGPGTILINQNTAALNAVNLVLTGTPTPTPVASPGLTPSSLTQPLADLIAQNGLTTTTSTLENADQVPLRVFGIRKFFLSRR